MSLIFWYIGLGVFLAGCAGWLFFFIKWFFSKDKMNTMIYLLVATVVLNIGNLVIQICKPFLI